MFLKEIDRSPVSGYLVSLSIEYRKVKLESKRHDYQLQVLLKNEGTSNIVEWHVDVLFPTNLLDPSVTFALEVPDRSDDKITFFRSSQETHNGVIYPGDEKLVMTIDYYVDLNIFRMRQDLFQNKVSAISYVHDQKVANVEKSVSDLHIF